MKTLPILPLCWGSFLLLLALFCDYYNSEGGCEWHYEPCGKPCMKTCRNPSGKCYNRIPDLEGKTHTHTNLTLNLTERKPGNSCWFKETPQFQWDYCVSRTLVTKSKTNYDHRLPNKFLWCSTFISKSLLFQTFVSRLLSTMSSGTTIFGGSHHEVCVSGPVWLLWSKWETLWRWRQRTSTKLLHLVRHVPFCSDYCGVCTLWSCILLSIFYMNVEIGMESAAQARQSVGNCVLACACKQSLSGFLFTLQSSVWGSCCHTSVYLI